MSQSHRALTTRDVFACDVTLEQGLVQVGILILSEDLTPGLHLLYDVDTSQPCCIVEIIRAISPQYKVELNVPALQDTQKV